MAMKASPFHASPATTSSLMKACLVAVTSNTRTDGLRAFSHS